MSSNRDEVRIPNLPIGHIVDDNGYPTDDELTFTQVLVTNLQKLVGNNGLVMPTVNNTEMLQIQNNTDINQQKTCAFGTLLYNKDTNKIMAAVDDGTGNPIFVVVV